MYVHVHLGAKGQTATRKHLKRIQNLLFDLEVVFGIVRECCCFFAACSLDSCLCRSSAYCATLMTFGYQPLLVLYNIIFFCCSFLSNNPNSEKQQTHRLHTHKPNIYYVHGHRKYSISNLVAKPSWMKIWREKNHKRNANRKYPANAPKTKFLDESFPRKKMFNAQQMQIYKPIVRNFPSLHVKWQFYEFE